MLLRNDENEDGISQAYHPLFVWLTILLNDYMLNEFIFGNNAP